MSRSLSRRLASTSDDLHRRKYTAVTMMVMLDIFLRVNPPPLEKVTENFGLELQPFSFCDMTLNPAADSMSCAI